VEALEGERHAAAPRPRAGPLEKLPLGHGASGDAAMEDLDAKLVALAADITKTSQAEQDRYDAETDHGKRPEAQREWTANIALRLLAAHISDH
jgi:hypothetical protein